MKRGSSVWFAIGAAAASMGVGAARAADITPKEYAAAINVAGRQRMLSQKMAKEFLLAQLGVDPTDNKSKLQEDMQLFEGSLQSLMNGNPQANLPVPSREIKSQFEQVRLLWSNYKVALVAESADAVKRVSMFGDPVLREADKAVKLYEKEAQSVGVKAGAVVNIAGRQRMFSQQMSKQILLIALKTDADENLSKLKATAALFDESHNNLIKGNDELGIPKTKNPAILAQMKKVGDLWKAFKAIVDQVAASGQADKGVAEQVAGISGRLLAEADKATGLYAGTAK